MNDTLATVLLNLAAIGFICALVVIGLAYTSRSRGEKYIPTLVTLENGDQYWEVRMGYFRKGSSLKDARDGSDTLVTFHDLRDRLAGGSPTASQVTLWDAK